MNRLTDRRHSPMLQCRRIDFWTHAIQILRHRFEVMAAGPSTRPHIASCGAFLPSAPASGRFAPCVRRAARRNTQEGSLPNRGRSSWESEQFYFDRVSVIHD